MPGDSDIFRGPPNQRTPLTHLLIMIWYRVWELTGFNNGSGSGGIVVVPSTGAPVTLSKTASSTTTIPIGAFNIGILILTGTGTIQGVSWPSGTPWNVVGKTNAAFDVVLGSPGTAVINYLL